MRDPMFHRLTERVHRLGPRALGELLAEIADEFDAGQFTFERLDAYAHLRDEDLDTAGGRTMPPSPVHRVF